MRREPLPEELPTTFRVRDATAVGVPLDRLRAAPLDRSVWGVRREGKAVTIEERCELLSARLRDDATISHTTAALLYGIPLDFAHERGRCIHVSTPFPGPAPRARGIIGHRCQLSDTDIRVLRGLRITSPVRTWLDLGGMLDLGDLVAAGDHLVRHRAPLTTVPQLRSAVAGYGGRGVRLLREAVPLLDARSESRPESRLRVLLAVAGLPRPIINHTLVHAESGARLRPDFQFERERVILEYQGDYHRTRAQWRADMTRWSTLESLGSYVMELNADDLRSPRDLIARVTRVLRSREVEAASSGRAGRAASTEDAVSARGRVTRPR